MKSQGFTLVELVVALCILALISSFWYVWYKDQMGQKSAASLHSTITPTPLTSTIVSNWLSYIDSAGDYSLSYPRNWKVDPLGGGYIKLKDQSNNQILTINPLKGADCIPTADAKSQPISFTFDNQQFSNITGLCTKTSYYILATSSKLGDMDIFFSYDQTKDDQAILTVVKSIRGLKAGGT